MSFRPTLTQHPSYPKHFQALFETLHDALAFQDLKRLAEALAPYTLTYNGIPITLAEAHQALNGQDLECTLAPGPQPETTFTLHLAWLDNNTFERCTAVLPLHLRAPSLLDAGPLRLGPRLPAGSPSATRCDPVIVCTSATHRTPAFTNLEVSCRLHKVPLTVINKGAPYRGFGYNKLRTLYWFLKSRELLATHILFVDAFDTLFATGLVPILEHFHRIGSPILFSAELNCFPGNSGQTVDDYPPAPTPFRFLNSGGFLGEIPALLDLMERFQAHRIAAQSSDQWWWARVFLQPSPQIQLDYHCHIFQSLFQASKHITLRRTLPINELTRSHPCILHGNGHTSLDRFNEALLGPTPFPQRFRRRLKRRIQTIHRVFRFLTTRARLTSFPTLK